jgi:multiple sugar transport system ATP-binding protein
VEAVRNLSLSIALVNCRAAWPDRCRKDHNVALDRRSGAAGPNDVMIRGRVVLKDVPAERDVAFVFQQYSLYPHLTVTTIWPFRCALPARRMNGNTPPGPAISEQLHIEQKLTIELRSFRR